MTVFTKETKPTTNFFKEQRPGQAAVFGKARFGYSRFGTRPATVFTRETKPTTNFTKETKP